MSLDIIAATRHPSSQSCLPALSGAGTREGSQSGALVILCPSLYGRGFLSVQRLRLVGTLAWRVLMAWCEDVKFEGREGCFGSELGRRSLKGSQSEVGDC